MGSVRSITEEEKQERREMILEAARKRFQRFGYSKTTMDEIASDAGISKGTIYLYFENKEDIFNELLASEALEMERYLYRKVKDETSVLLQLEMIFSCALDYLEKHPFLDNILSRDVDMVSPRIIKYVFSVEERYVSVVEDYVRRGIDKGEIKPFNPRITAYILYKIFEAFSYGSTLKEEKFNKEDTLDIMRHFISKGLARQE
jgi:TetR/AcrR family transcriptional regulator of autoinduction and epiphytic fitness